VANTAIVTMIFQISFVAVPTSEFRSYLEEMERITLPAYEGAGGLISVVLLRRVLVAYIEVATISTWRSKEELAQFLKHTSPTATAVNHVVMWRGETAYELIVARTGKPLAADDDCFTPEYKEGAD
jgi:heme-degrading monooxygenase HmoA